MEYFIPGLRDELLTTNRLHIAHEKDYFPAVVRYGVSDNGVFGMVLHAVQTPFFLSKAALYKEAPQKSLRATLDETFPNLRYLFLYRNNRTAQAVSYYRAAMTDEWRRKAGAPPPPADETLAFSHVGIEKCRLLLDASERYWEGYFAAYHISPLRIEYEEFAKNYESVVRKVFEYLSVSPRTAVPPPAIERVANARSQEWIRQSDALGRLYTDADVLRVMRGWGPY